MFESAVFFLCVLTWGKSQLHIADRKTHCVMLPTRPEPIRLPHLEQIAMRSCNMSCGGDKSQLQTAIHCVMLPVPRVLSRPQFAQVEVVASVIGFKIGGYLSLA